MSRTVLLKRKANATNLPDHVYAEAKRKIGSTFGANGDINTGLSFGEQKKWLPGIIGVDSKDVNFQKEVKKYFQNLTILVENSGTKLEVGLDQDGDPINLMDYVRYKFACAHPYVAENEQAIGTNRRYKYYIYDTEIEKVKSFLMSKSVKKRTKNLLNLQQMNQKLISC